MHGCVVLLLVIGVTLVDRVQSSTCMDNQDDRAVVWLNCPFFAVDDGSRCEGVTSARTACCVCGGGILVGSPAPPPKLSPTGAPVISLTRSIATEEDDGEEYRTNANSRDRGEVVLDSSDLELCREGTSTPRYQYVGLRFTNITVPEDATIVSALVEFSVDAIDSRTGYSDVVGIDKDINLKITGEYVDNASPFSTRDFDISRRISPGTPNTISWSEKEQWHRYPTRTTNDIGPVIQDIVSRAGWRPGNALVLVLYGNVGDSGTRVAYSIDQAGLPLAPRLIVDYFVDQPTTAPKPTTAPTSLPTPSPTVRPTSPPTFVPTTQPTPSPTPSPTPNPVKPTTIPETLSPTQNQIPFPTLSPTQSTPEPTNVPTTDPTPIPTFKLTSSPTPAPTQKQDPNPPSSTIIALDTPTGGTGEECNSNNDCKSNTCRNGVCMASSECYPIKHVFGKPFDKNAINIVFVGSRFDGTSSEDWRTQVNTTYASFRNYNMFSEDIDQLNVFLVDPLKSSTSFCSFGCAGVARLLCCDVQKTESLASKCFPVGANLQTVVIHNDSRYGGAGYRDKNIATVSTHLQGPLVAIHELGHSLFELGDEYWYSPDTDELPNCASSSGCSKWSDLIGNTPDGYTPVSCVPGCHSWKYFVANTASYMNELDDPVGAVNSRFTCCTYQALTKSMPSYCDVFDFSPNYLFNYCKNNDYQHYGASNYDIDQKDNIKSNSIAPPPNQALKYTYATEPMLVKIKIRKNGKAVSREEPVPLPSGMYRKSQVWGEFRSVKHARKEGVDSCLKVTVFYLGGRKDVLFFSQETRIEVPRPPTYNETADDEPRTVSQKSRVVEVVVNTMGRNYKRVRARVLSTTETATVKRTRTANETHA